MLFPQIPPSNTLSANNALQLLGNTWAIPEPIGATTPNSIVGTTLSADSLQILTDGSGASPTLNNFNNSTTGLFWETNVLGFTANGSEIARIQTTDLTLTQPLKVPNGTAGSPSLSLSSESTGFYRVASNQLGLSIAGTNKYTFTSTELSFQNHLKSAGTAPTIAAGAAAGSSPTVTLVAGATDTCGQISVVSGSSGATTGVMATVTFNSSWSANPKVILIPANSNASQLNFFQGTISTTQFTLDTQNTLANSTTYLFNYHVIG